MVAERGGGGDGPHVLEDRHSAIPSRALGGGWGYSSAMPNTRISITVRLEGGGAPPSELTGYLFDARGALIASAPLRDGSLDFDAPAESLARARVFVAPEAAAGAAPTVESMRRLAAYEPALRLQPGRVELLIPSDVFGRWPLCLCRVPGRVVRPIEIRGEVHEMPVCHARVHLCEVDPRPLIFRRIPDRELIRLRDELLRLVDPPVIRRPPLPDPPRLGVDPRLAPRLVAPRAEVRVGFAAPEAAEAIPFAGVMPLSLSAEDRRALAEVPALPAEFRLAQPVRDALAAPTPAAIRDALELHADALMPVLARWPWIWPFLRCDEIAVVETDERGRFEARFFYPCKGDQPDIYVWVEYCIGGAWTTVHRPPMAWSTRWNYACGSEITVRVTDPRVPWCGDAQTLPGTEIGVITIGNAINVRQIDRATGLAPGGRPFGGSLEPTVWFGENLGSIATHYRWSYRPIQADGTPLGPWSVADDRDVGRHYGVITALGTLVFKSYKLGPDEAVPSDILYKIPPKSPPAGSWAPQVNARANTASAYFITGTPSELKRVPDGLYELKLELFKVTSGPGGAVTVTQVSGLDFRVPPAATPAPFPTEVDLPMQAAPAEYLVKDGGGKVTGFCLRVRVDNNRCTAEIHATEVPGSTQECGFITYPPVVGAAATLRFRAAHENNFATFSFSVVRGRCGVPGVGASGPVGSSPEDGYVLDSGGVYGRAVPIVTLMSPLPPWCPERCTRAAFAEHLHVNATATDGWGELDYLDGHAVAAFALAPIA